MKCICASNLHWSVCLPQLQAGMYQLKYERFKKYEQHFSNAMEIVEGNTDFFFTHLYKYRESWLYPISFVGSVAYGFKDVLKGLCDTYELELGIVLKQPMDGLAAYHND